MLVLSRKKSEKIVIDGCIEIEVLKIDGNKIKLGIHAPAHVKILRSELQPFALEYPQAGTFGDNPLVVVAEACAS